ncbi:SIMPL domain-containing protein [Sphingobacterium sp. HJSM2_6]|uniref:SIMPL domain-containing protein n=1 Tax=Sphingobacterium sp. HJSM2_6 TaxID=3366264 RepID=UPI003BC504EB
MKKILSILALCTFLLSAQAQQQTMENSRRISTRGYAEKEVTPDIIYLSISLKEYFIDGNTKKKVPVETLEKQLFDAAIKNGIEKADITIQNIYSYNYQTKKKNTELLQSRQYRIKVSNLNKLNEILDAVDAKGLQSTNIDGYDHSKKVEIEKELRKLAVKNARNNAEILAEAENEQLGKVILINDNSSLNWNDIMPQPRMYSMAKTSNLEEQAVADGIDLDIKPIKLICNLDAVFEIK